MAEQGHSHSFEIAIGAAKLRGNGLYKRCWRRIGDKVTAQLAGHEVGACRVLGQVGEQQIQRLRPFGVGVAQDGFFARLVQVVHEPCHTCGVGSHGPTGQQFGGLGHIFLGVARLHPQGVQQDLIDRLLLIHQGGGQLNGNLTDVGAIDEVLVDPRVVPMTAQARDAFRVLDHELLGRLRLSRGTGFSSILARIEENATKLALIRAVSRDALTPQIEDHDAHWGIALSRHCAELTIREATARVSENQVESNHKRALQILRDGDAAGMSKSEFTRRTQFMDHRQRDGVLRTLTDAHLVEMFAKPTGGRPSQWVKLADADE